MSKIRIINQGAIELIESDFIDEAHSSVVGGSTAERRIMCPGSLKLEQQYAQVDTGSEYAAEGTALHAAMEWLLNTYYESLVPTPEQAKTVIGKTFNDIVITSDLYTDKIAPALTAFEEIIEKYDIVDFLVEVKADIPAIPGAFGTIDILGITSTGAIAAIDWKFGDGIYVDVEGSYQLAFYTTAAICTKKPAVVEFLEGAKASYTSYIFAIVQPRRGRDEEPYRVWETDDAFIDDFSEQLFDAIKKGQSGNAPLRTGKHCWKCKAELKCPEKQKHIGNVPDKKPDLMSAIELSGYLKKADQIESWVKAVRNYAHKELEKGVKIPGFKLVDKRGSRVYSDEALAEKRLVRELKMAGAYSKKLISPSQAEKALGKKRYSKLIAPCVSIVSSGTTLAPDDDKRREIVTETKMESIQKIDTSKSIFDQ